MQDFELRGRRLGRLEIEARNRATQDGQREWRLASSTWRCPRRCWPPAAAGPWSAARAQRRSGAPAWTLRWTLRDSGALLARFGMDGVLRRGKGRIAGQVGWLGSPLSPDYRSMTGQMHVDVESGQFLKADPGLAKLLGVLESAVAAAAPCAGFPRRVQ